MINYFTPHFNDIINVYSISIIDDNGQEKKSESLLYGNIKSSVVDINKSKGNIGTQDYSEGQKLRKRFDVESQYNGANRGDKIVFSGIDYIIIDIDVDTDFNNNVFCIKYYAEQRN